jgi:hypothetical protein
MMGLVSGLLLLPVRGPLQAFRFFLERIHEEAEAILRDEGRAFAELIDLSMRHTAGQLNDADYAEQEARLLDELNSIRDYRDELLHADAEADEGEWEEEEEEEEYAEQEDEEAWW